MINIIVKFDKKDYNLCVDSLDISFNELLADIEKSTGIIPENQKIIYKGKILYPSADKLSTYGFRNNCKLMLLKIKQNVDTSLSLLKIKEVERKVSNIESIIDDLHDQMLGIQKGFLDVSHMTTAINQIRKTILHQTENLNLLLEKLDTISIDVADETARSARKSSVHKIQVSISRLDDLLATVNQSTTS